MNSRAADVPQEMAEAFPASIDDAGRRLRDGSLTAERLTSGYLSCVERLQPVLNAMITVLSEQAIEDARRLDAELADGHDRGPLHGIPIVLKDNIDTGGVRTTVGSEFLRNRIPDEDAEITRRLKRAGAIIIGKANQSEFSSGSSGVNVFHGNVHNPWDLERAPGGSSSGTGAAVASGMALAGIGTDAGGSVRQPASRCGIFGLRPTFGRISLAGVWPRTRTLGAAGPMTRCVKDAARIMNVLVSQESGPEDFTLRLDDGVGGLRLALIKDYTFSDIDDEVEEVLRQAVDVLSRLGAEIIEVDIPALTGELDYARLFSNVLLYEFNQILGDQYRSAPKHLFGPAVHSDIERGAAVTEDTYTSILRERSKHTARVREVFQHVDALLAPVLPNVTPLQTAGPDVWARGRQFNLPFSFLGLPAVSVPAGFACGMPVGLQVIADSMEESLLLQISSAFEAATDFHTRRPPISCEPA